MGSVPRDWDEDRPRCPKCGSLWFNTGKTAVGLKCMDCSKVYEYEKKGRK